MSRKTNELVVMGFTAGGSITAKRFVKWHSTDGQVVAAGDGDPVLGVILGNDGETFAAGDPVQVCLFGITDVEAGGAVTQNACVGAGTGGKAAAISLGVSTADNDLGGMALETCTTDGDIISVFVGRNPFAGNA